MPAAIVEQDAPASALMDAGRVDPGHVIVASRREAVTLRTLAQRLRDAPGEPPCAAR